jgi:hypothetical protein
MTHFRLRCLALGLAMSASAAMSPPAWADDTVTVGPKEQRAQQRKRNAALEAANAWAKRYPERYARLVPPGADLSPGSVPIEFTRRGGGVGQTVADSLGQTVLSLGYTELKGRDKANLGRLYTQLYNLLPAQFRAGLADPVVVVGLPLRQLQQRVRQIGERIVLDLDAIRLIITRTSPVAGLFVNPIGVCSAEIGWEAGGADNENSARCEVADYASLGILRKLDFILKDDLTCVKDQASRGTCTAHAVAANVETMIQVQGGVPENLAEQDLYFWAKIETDMSGRYTDGLNPDEVYDALDAQDFEIQYEAHWNYNQSPDRDPLDANNEFPNSCDLANYTGEMCTDYAFQAVENSLGLGYYAYMYPVRASTGWEILNWTNVPDLAWLGVPDFQIDTAILMLEGEYPVHISLVVPNAFRTPDANGYVQHNPADPVPGGSHSVLAVGFVANADLPAGVPADPDGRGYVVIKNSWGTDYADCGFAYLSTEFLRQWAYAYRYLDKTVTFN